MAMNINWPIGFIGLVVALARQGNEPQANDGLEWIGSARWPPLTKTPKIGIRVNKYKRLNV